MLEVGKTGLFTAKKSLETTGHNIANANTKGFSRQRVDQQSNRPISKYGLHLGTGANVKQIKRVHDANVEKRLNTAISTHQFFDERSLQLSQIEKVFNEIDAEGLHKVLGQFYNSFRQLANKPEDETVRSIVRDNAQLVINDFRTLRQKLDEAARAIDRKIANSIIEVNEKIQLITELNVKIKGLEATGVETGDYRDRRDKAVRELSEYLKLHYYYDNKGAFSVLAKGIGSIVTGGTGHKLAAVHKSKRSFF